MSEWTYIGDVQKLPEGPDKRDLEWCATIAELAQGGIERRAINIATGIAIRLLNEKATEK